jgi:Bax protein
MADSNNMTRLRHAILSCRAFCLITVLLLSVTGQKPAFAESYQIIDINNPQTIRPDTTSGMQAFFQTLDYNWSQLEDGVPLFILEGIPHDIDDVGSTADKKRAFFMGLLPMVLVANQEIAKERHDLLQILQRQQVMEPYRGDQDRLDKIMGRYGLRGDPFTDHRTRSELLRRVDTLPPALVLAQAANESAWGTSRFAQLGNNLFGEWTYIPGAGIVPENRPEGQTYEVRRFKSIYASIRSYMNNLNRNSAYAKLRKIRERLRNANQPVTGMALAHGLLNYSQRGTQYIDEIQAMIRQNKLSQVNAAFLRRRSAENMISISTSGSGLFSTRNRMIGHLSPLWLNP